jgi:hypothetical protein
LTDYQLMQIGSLVATFLTKRPVDIESMRLKFTADDKPEFDIEEMTEEEIQEWAREVSENRRQMLIAQNRKAKPNGD